MTREIVEIQPTELKFIVELKRQSSCSVQLINTSDQYVAYKVKTTNPKGYCVRPNIGVILPKSPCEIIVTMQAPRNSPADMQCRDKFLIQSTVVTEGTMSDDISPELFAKGNGRVVEEKKLRVVLISPVQSPTSQSTNDIMQEPLYGVHSPMLEPITVVKKQEHVQAQAPVYGTDSSVVRSVESTKNQDPLYEARSPAFQSLNGVIKDGIDYEAVKPMEKVRLFTGSSFPSQAVAKDVEDLKAKLTEAEKTITSLREERSAIIQQRDAAQQELVTAKRRRIGHVRVGYPFLFVCFTAFVGFFSGYMLHP